MLHVDRLNRRLELREEMRKGKPRLLLSVYVGTHRESIVWLSCTPGDARVNDICVSRPDVYASDLTEAFKEVLFKHSVDMDAAAADADAVESSQATSSTSRLFEPVAETMAEVDSFKGRERLEPVRMAPTESVRSRAFGSRRKRKELDGVGDLREVCNKQACAAARAERDAAQAARDTAVAQSAKLRTALSEIAQKLDIGDGLLGLAAQSVQHALMEILDDGIGDLHESAALDEQVDTQDEQDDCAKQPAESAPPKLAPRQSPPTLTLSPPPLPQWTAYLVSGSTRSLGRITITATALVWKSSRGAADSECNESLNISLTDISDCGWTVTRITPFERMHRCSLGRVAAAPIFFDFPHKLPSDDVSGSFATSLEIENTMKTAVEACKTAAATALQKNPTTSADATSTQDAATPALPTASARAPAPPTKRHRAGKKLREQLLELNRLRNRGKAKEAAELARSLEESTPPTATAASKLDSLARQRVRELRDTAFSFGGLQLTRQILQRFFEMPEVRQLFTAELLQRHSDAVDGETGRLLIKAAKDFFCELLKAPRGDKATRGGRRTDEDRNAHAAALAALLPSDLFENRRGRAAMRLLGLTYRQVKRGTELRGEMEDRAGGWKRIKTSEHYDKAPT